MKLALPIETTVIATTAPIDTVPEFDPTYRGPYKEGDLWRYGDDIFVVNKAPAEDGMVQTYAADSVDYHIGSIVWRNDRLEKVIATEATEIPKNPEDYDCIDTNLDQRSWTCRYVKVNSGSSNYTKTLGQYRHQKTATTYTLSWSTTTYSWTALQYVNGAGCDDPDRLFLYQPDPYYLAAAYWDLPNCQSVYDGSSDKPEGSIFYGKDGIRYKTGGIAEDYGSYWYRSIARENVDTQSFSLTNGAKTASESNTAEGVAIIDDSSEAYKWRGQFFIMRGNDLYMRTHVNVVQEFNTVTANETEAVAGPADVEFLSPQGVSDWLKPFDGKNYTYLEAPGPISYTISNPTEKFDTVAMDGIVCESVDVTFKDDLGNVVYELLDYIPDVYRDIDARLEGYKTTIIETSDVDVLPGGSCEVVFKGDVVRIGTIMLGLSVHAGFTNLVFKNRFIDYSPYEKDQWGNILYIPGVKVNVFSGTVDIKITNYDMMHRLMTSIGGETVIIDGSDKLLPDSQSVFASTKLIGRVREFELKTDMKYKRMGDYATYTFKMEADV